MGEMFDMYGAYPDTEPYVHSHNPCDGDRDLVELTELTRRRGAGEILDDEDFERVRRAAMKAVSRARRQGELKPTPCARCGSDDYVEAHHESYAREDWLHVTWLCRSCHDDQHPGHTQRFRRRRK
jgi:hypothetical protein